MLLQGQRPLLAAAMLSFGAQVWDREWAAAWVWHLASGKLTHLFLSNAPVDDEEDWEDDMQVWPYKLLLQHLSTVRCHVPQTEFEE